MSNAVDANDISDWMREGDWLHYPASIQVADDDKLLIEAVKGSDFWRKTGYGFERDSGHALLSPFPVNSSIQVSFIVDYSGLFDQAGVFVRLDELNWLKVGVEYINGCHQIAAVMTSRGQSDWSCLPVRDWHGKQVTVRASRAGDSVTIRAKLAGGAFQFVRLVPFDETSELRAGLYCCAPEREGLIVAFSGVERGKADLFLPTLDPKELPSGRACPI